MKNYIFLTFVFVLFLSCSQTPQNLALNSQAEEEWEEKVFNEKDTKNYMDFSKKHDLTQKKIFLFLDTNLDGKSDSIEVHNHFINFMRITEAGIRRGGQSKWRITKFKKEADIFDLNPTEKELMETVLNLRR